MDKRQMRKIAKRYKKFVVNVELGKHDIDRINEYLNSGEECEIEDILNDIICQVDRCPICGGSGEETFDPEDDCIYCDGTGRTPKRGVMKDGKK